jgi:ABC-type Fe3+/spermidine/putrescine transport system ATPase subunit
VLTIRGLSKRFDGFLAVDNVDLDVNPGEIMALLGPSGCGKTTTLRLVAGLSKPTSGDIAFDGMPFASGSRGIHVAPEKRNVGMVFQSYALWPHMTVAQNVGYPLRLRRRPAAEIHKRVLEALELMELANLADQTVPKLSGGQQQRVALARALVYEPSLVLFDEPFSNLDAQLRTQMRIELKALRRKVRMTGLFVTHDQVEALSLSDRVAIMKDGHIEQVGVPIEVYRHPATRFVRDFLGKVVNLHGVVRSVGADGAVDVDLEAATGGPIRAHSGSGQRLGVGDLAEISIRPEYVEILPAETAASRSNVVAGTVGDLLFTGESFEARVHVGRETVLVHLPADGTWHESQPIALHLRGDATTAWLTERPGTSG